MWSPSLLFIYNIFYRTESNFGPLKRSHHYGIFIGCHHGTGRVHHWLLAVTLSITMAIVKTIVIVGCLSYRSRKISPRALWYKRLVKMTQIAYSDSFWMQFRVSCDLFTDLTAGETTVRTFLPRWLTAASRIQNCTYQTPSRACPVM